MTMNARLSVGFAMLVAFLLETPALAAEDNLKSYLKSTGSGTACTLAAPCNVFQNAYDATVPGGEINCLDSGFFSTGSILKSITIDCAGGTMEGLVVNGVSAIVRIRNLSLNSFIAGTGSNIDFRTGAGLFVENCVVQNSSTSLQFGIRFRPSNPGAQLVVTDTVLSNNGSGSTGGGILVAPQAGGTAEVVLSRVTAAKNVFGIAADGTGSTGGINMTITDSVASGNSQDGIVATTPAGGAPIGVLVKNTRSVNNNIGIRSIGPNVTVRVDGSTVTGNSTGLRFVTGGALLSFGNNNVIANGADGAFSGTVGLQ
jgi:hypothetical protein